MERRRGTAQDSQQQQEQQSSKQASKQRRHQRQSCSSDKAVATAEPATERSTQDAGSKTQDARRRRDAGRQASKQDAAYSSRRDHAGHGVRAALLAAVSGGVWHGGRCEARAVAGGRWLLALLIASSTLVHPQQPEGRQTRRWPQRAACRARAPSANTSEAERGEQVLEWLSLRRPQSVQRQPARSQWRAGPEPTRAARRIRGASTIVHHARPAHTPATVPEASPLRTPVEALHWRQLTTAAAR